MNTQPVDITLELSSEFQSYTWMRALIELPVKPLSSANIIPGDPRAPAPFPSALSTQYVCSFEYVDALLVSSSRYSRKSQRSAPYPYNL